MRVTIQELFVLCSKEQQGERLIWSYQYDRDLSQNGNSTWDWAPQSEPVDLERCAAAPFPSL